MFHWKSNIIVILLITFCSFNLIRSDCSSADDNWLQSDRHRAYCGADATDQNRQNLNDIHSEHTIYGLDYKDINLLRRVDSVRKDNERAVRNTERRLVLTQSERRIGERDSAVRRFSEDQLVRAQRQAQNLRRYAETSRRDNSIDRRSERSSIDEEVIRREIASARARLNERQRLIVNRRLNIEYSRLERSQSSRRQHPMVDVRRELRRDQFQDVRRFNRQNEDNLRRDSEIDSKSLGEVQRRDLNREMERSARLTRNARDNENRINSDRVVSRRSIDSRIRARDTAVRQVSQQRKLENEDGLRREQRNLVPHENRLNEDRRNTQSGVDRRNEQRINEDRVAKRSERKEDRVSEREREGRTNSFVQRTKDLASRQNKRLMIRSEEHRRSADTENRRIKHQGIERTIDTNGRRNERGEGIRVDRIRQNDQRKVDDNRQDERRSIRLAGENRIERNRIERPHFVSESIDQETAMISSALAWYMVNILVIAAIVLHVIKKDDTIKTKSFGKYLKSFFAASEQKSTKVM